MFKLEFDPSNKELSGAIGRALTEYSGGAVETVTEVSRTASAPAKEDAAPEPVEKQADDAPVAFNSDAGESTPVDELGTPHNPDYCVGVKSAKPFYTSGSNKGQWKKKPGVDESDYNEWYAATMPVQEEEEETPVNTSAAFGAKTEQAPPAGDGPKTSGDLMAYISEQQAAGNLSQEMVQKAYTTTGVQINDLFDSSKEAEAVTKLYHCIDQLIAANA